MPVLAPGGRELPPWLDRLLMWGGHYCPGFMAAGFAVVVVQAVLPLSSASPFYIPGDVVLYAFLASMFADVFAHSRRLCERCLRKLPVNAQEKASRRRWALRFSHSRWRFFPVPVTAAWLVFLFLVKDHRADSIGLAVMFACSFSSVVITEIHKRLQPWCPWCRWGDGGGREISPDIPVPTVSR
jgi:hypothetical protein